MSAVEKDRLSVGDEVVRITGNPSGDILGTPSVVERLTPTGIAVLANGDRLVPSGQVGLADPMWRIRGERRNVWRSVGYCRVDSPRVLRALRKARIKSSERDIDNSHEMLRRLGPGQYSPEAVQDLIDACNKHLDFLRSLDEEETP